MKEEITIHLTPKHINDFQQFFTGKKPFLEIEGKNVQSFGYKIEPSSDDFEFPEKFPNCCPFHKSIDRNAKSWFEDFPNCCLPHKKYSKSKWFNKSQYNGVIDKILHSVIYTEEHITKVSKNNDWFQDITEYIDYVVESFGNPAIGLNQYARSIQFHIENRPNFPKFKRIKLSNYINKYYNEPNQKATSLNQLYSTIQKWIKVLPNLLHFKELKDTYSHGLAIDLIGFPGIYNRYSKRVKRKIRTNDELVEFLFDLTKQHLRKANSTMLINSGKISDIIFHQSKIIDEKHLLNQQELFNKYSSNELKYINFLKKWLNNEYKYFKDKNDYINSISQKNILDKSLEISIENNRKLSSIQTNLGELYFAFERISLESRNMLSNVLNKIDEIDLDGIKEDFDNPLFIQKLSELIAKERDNFTPNESSELREKINSPNLEIKEKFKIAIGIFAFKYELEVENKSTWELPRSWREWKKLFIEEY